MLNSIFSELSRHWIISEISDEANPNRKQWKWIQMGELYGWSALNLAGPKHFDSEHHYLRILHWYSNNFQMTALLTNQTCSNLFKSVLAECKQGNAFLAKILLVADIFLHVEIEFFLLFASSLYLRLKITWYNDESSYSFEIIVSSNSYLSCFLKSCKLHFFSFLLIIIFYFISFTISTINYLMGCYSIIFYFFNYLIDY